MSGNASGSMAFYPSNFRSYASLLEEECGRQVWKKSLEENVEKRGRKVWEEALLILHTNLSILILCGVEIAACSKLDSMPLLLSGEM
jgi:hypothetical protein